MKRAKDTCEKMDEYFELEEYKMVNTLLTVVDTRPNRIFGTVLLFDSYHHVNTPDLQEVIDCVRDTLMWGIEHE